MLGVILLGFRAYVKDFATGSHLRISDTRFPATAVRISRDGSWATSVNDHSGGSTFDVRNTSTGQGVRVAYLCACTTEASEAPAISVDGRFIAFMTTEFDVDGYRDVYLHDRDPDQDGIFDEAGQISQSLVGIRPQGDSPWGNWPGISDDGRIVTFIGNDFGAPPVAYTGLGQLYARNVTSSTTDVISQGSHSAQSVDIVRPTGGRIGNVSSLSADGRYVAFSAIDAHLGADPNPGFTDVFVRDRVLGKTYYASVLPGEQIEATHRYRPSLSADGRYLAFETTLSISGDQESSRQLGLRRVYLRDLAAGCEIVCVDEVSPRLVPDAPNLTYVVAVDSRQSSPSYSPSLYAGLSYQVRVSGSYLFSTGPYLADAECSTLDGVTWAPSNFGDTYLNLLIDGSQVTWVPEPGTESASNPACSTTHTYVTTITGQYRPFGFQISDVAYHDNAGWLTVVIKPAH